MGFSVVIPMYNAEKFIERTVSSVLNQTYHDFEVIVVDDGSTDNSVKIVETLMKNTDKLRILKQKNQLVGAARNYGIKESKYEFVGLLDADDEYLPDFLNTIARLINEYPSAGVYATAYKVQKEDKSFIPKYSSLPKFPWEGIVPSYYKSALNYHPLSSSSVVLRKNILEKTGYFVEGVRYGVDLDLWVRIAAQFDIAFSSKVCAVYHRAVGVSLSVEKRTNYDRKVEETLGKVIESKKYKQQDELYINMLFNKLHMDTAAKYIKAGNKVKAKEHLDKIKNVNFATFLKKLKMQLKLVF